MLDLLIMLVALVCAPAMVYGVWAGRQRAKGHDVPPFSALVRAAWLTLSPWLELVGWAAGRVLAPARLRPAPRLLADNADYVVPDEVDLEADEQTDGQTDPVSAQYDAIGRLSVDRTRGAVIDVLVRAGWDVGRIRGVLKGDNGVIGAEVAAARQRLGLDTPTRTITVSERVDGKPQTREVAL